MNKALDSILEECLRKIEQQGWTVESCLARYPAQRAELEPLLRAALLLRQARVHVRPSEVFRAQSAARLRARLHAVRRSPQARPARPAFGGMRLWRLAAAGLLVIALALASGGLAYAADGAAPGDPLYVLDRALEQAQLRFTVRSAHAVQLRLRFASERLDEAAQLVAAGDAAHVQQALADYAALIASVRQTAGPTASVVAGAALGDQQVRLVGLLLSAPPESQPSIEDALDASSPPDAARAGAPCDAAQVQPALTALAERYGASYEDLLARFCAGYGVGTISRAYRLSAEGGVPVEEVFARHEAGQSWGAIQQELHKKNGPPQEAPGQSGNAPGKPAETPQPPDEAPGRSGEAPGQSNRPPDRTPGPPESPPGRSKDKDKDQPRP